MMSQMPARTTATPVMARARGESVWRRCLWGLAVIPGTAGCAPAKEASPPPTHVVQEGAPPPRVDFRVDDVRELFVRERGLVVSVPQPERWRAEPSRGSWSSYVDASSDVRLWLRAASARRSVTPDECEKEARLSFRELQAPGEEVAREPLRLGEMGIDGGAFGDARIEIFPEENAQAGGRAFVHLAAVNRCISVVVTSPRVVDLPERLEFALHVVLPSVRVRRVDERGEGSIERR